MSELKKDYTTPEQSKKLLELGIPIESANIVYYHTPDSLHDPYLITEKRQIENLKAGKGLPCWSVGRLIEIMKVCSDLDPILGYQIAYNTKHQPSLLHIVIQVIEDYINELNFSKLEGKYENLFNSILV